MLTKRLTVLFILMIAGSAVTMTGCFFPSQGPSFGLLSIPIPVSPYWQKQLEDEFYVHERYARVPILGPITSGGPGGRLGSAQ